MPGLWLVVDDFFVETKTVLLPPAHHWGGRTTLCIHHELHPGRRKAGQESRICRQWPE